MGTYWITLPGFDKVENPGSTEFPYISCFYACCFENKADGHTDYDKPLDPDTVRQHAWERFETRKPMPPDMSDYKVVKVRVGDGTHIHYATLKISTDELYQPSCGAVKMQSRSRLLGARMTIVDDSTPVTCEKCMELPVHNKEK